VAPGAHPWLPAQATPPGRRVLLLPGSLFADYRWGATSESVAPPLSSKPLLVRQAIRYADPRAAQLQDATDDLVQQERLVPGQLAPLLRLMGVGDVVVQTDDRTDQSGALPPAGVRDALSGQLGFRQRAAAVGPVRRFPPLWGRSGAGATLPELAVFPVRPAGAPLVRLQPLHGRCCGGRRRRGESWGWRQRAPWRPTCPSLSPGTSTGGS